MSSLFMQIVSSFLQRHHKKELPLLLAFSGGPDSLALLHFLIEYRKINPSFSFALAHVDHGWRNESSQEAELIAKMAEKLGLVLHLKKLIPKELQGNLEAACRDARLQFFSELCSQNGYQAVLLGHHADDLAETVLKRVLEGAPLPHLCGIQPITEYSSLLSLWRPLLAIQKKELLAWIESRGLQGFQDSTNEDTKFLRARFRKKIIPYLNTEFGKEISPALCRLGLEAAELRSYLDNRVAPFLSKIIVNDLGSLLDLTDTIPKEIVELKHLIRLYCNTHDFALSREALSTAAEIISKGGANKQVATGKNILYINRRRLFIPNQLNGDLGGAKGQ